MRDDHRRRALDVEAPREKLRLRVFVVAAIDASTDEAVGEESGDVRIRKRVLLELLRCAVPGRSEVEEQGAMVARGVALREVDVVEPDERRRWLPRLPARAREGDEAEE